MDEKDFEYLRELNETRNITKASERLFVTQAALSKRIKAIEAELGVQLFVRSHHGIHLTPEGERVMYHVGKAAGQLEQMKEELHSIGDEVQGTLKAGIPINYSFYSLPDVLDSYYRSYPKVRLQITTGQSRQLYQLMSDGKLDVAILRGDFSWEGAQYLLYQEHICVVRNRELMNRPLSECMYIDCNTDANQNILISRWFRENKISTLSSRIFLDNIPACMEIVKRGLGWSLVPEIALKDYQGSISPCYFENGEPLIRKTYLLCQPHSLKLPQVKAFCDLLCVDGCVDGDVSF